ncbi:hypothetical protein QOT17_000261 [Balamuthia mandrillaris]
MSSEKKKNKVETSESEESEEKNTASSSESEEEEESSHDSSSEGSKDKGKEKPRKESGAEATSPRPLAETRVSGDKITTEVKKKFFNSKDYLNFTCSIGQGPYKPGDKVEVFVKIENSASNQVKSIQAYLQTYKGVPKPAKKEGGKPKRGKPKKTGTDQEYFQGARFPLDGYVDYEGSIHYPLPKKLEETAEDTEHELLLIFDVKKTIGYYHIKAPLPVHVSN